jgi:hypothetical protein
VFIEAPGRAKLQQRMRVDRHHAGRIIEIDVDESRHAYADARSGRKIYPQPIVADLHNRHLDVAVHPTALTGRHENETLLDPTHVDFELLRTAT